MQDRVLLQRFQMKAMGQVSMASPELALQQFVKPAIAIAASFRLADVL